MFPLSHSGRSSRWFLLHSLVQGRYPLSQLLLMGFLDGQRRGRTWHEVNIVQVVQLVTSFVGHFASLFFGYYTS